MSLTVSEILALEGLSAMRLRAGQQGLQLGRQGHGFRRV